MGERPPTPQHDRLKRMQEAAPMLRAFLQFLQAQGLEIWSKIDKDPPRWAPASVITYVLFPKFFGIDQEALDVEKQALAEYEAQEETP